MPEVQKMANARPTIRSAIFFLVLLAGILWGSWILSGNPDSTKAVFERARSSLHKGDFNAAIDGFTEVIRRDPNLSIPYDDRAMAERELKLYDKSISDCDLAIKVRPSDYYAFVERGTSKAAKGDPEGAIADYLHAAELNPTNSYAFSEMGNADCQLMNFSEAIKCFTHAIELNPTNSIAYNGRGWAEFLKGDFDSSITDATRSIQLDSNSGNAYGTRGWARYGKGDMAGAVEDCKRAVQLSKRGSEEFFCDQGLLDFVTKDYQEAIVDWQNAIEQDPQLKEELLPWIEKAQKSEGK